MGNPFSMTSLKRKVDILGELPSAGSVYGEYLRIAWPSALEGMLTMLIAAVNLIMIGTLGTREVAAVGIISQPRMIIVAAAKAVAVAVTAIVSRRLGAGQKEEADRVFKQGFLICLIMTFSLCMILALFLSPILMLAGAKEEYLPLAREYSSFVVAEVFFYDLSIIINSGLIGSGNTKSMMISNIIGNGIKLLLNFLLVYGGLGFRKLGIRGAGIAEVAGALSCFIFSVLSVSSGKSPFRLFNRAGWRFDRTTVSGISRIGLSALLEQVFQRIGMFLYSRMVAEFGTAEYATHYIVMNLCDIYYSFSEGLGNASTSITGNKLGEGRPDLAVIYNRAGRRAGLILDTVAFLIYVLFRYPLMAMYSSEAEVIKVGGDLLIIVGIVCFIQTQAMIYAGALRGAGDTRYVALYSLYDIALFRPVATYVLCFPMGLGVYGAWISLILDQLIRATCATLRFRSNKWMYVRV
jgi:putative MATE family efflux protein